MLLIGLTKRTRETREWREWHAQVACERARELERAGDYEGARSALGKLWSRIGEHPATDELSVDS